MNTDLIKKIDNLYYYQTDEFATVTIKHFFTFENTPKNYVIVSVLSRYMEETNSVYKTSKKIRDMEKQLYGTRFSISNDSIGTKALISFRLKMIDHSLIEDDFFKDAIKYFKNMLFKPHFQNDELDAKVITQIKKDILDQAKNKEKDPGKFQATLLYRNLLPDSNFNNNKLYYSEIEGIISNLADKDIIDFYNNLLNNYISSYVFGNLNEEDIKYIVKSFSFKPIEFDYKYDLKETINEEYKVISTKDTSQSYLYVVYDIKDYKKENTYIYKGMQHFFNGFNGLCHTILRDKLGLVYSSYCEFFYNRGLFMICAQIDKKNVDAALAGIDEIMEELKNKETIERLLTYSKERYNQDLYTNTESLAFNLTDMEKYILKNGDTAKIQVDKINSLTPNDILKQLANFEKKYIFLYKGDKDEN